MSGCSSASTELSVQSGLIGDFELGHVGNEDSPSARTPYALSGPGRTDSVRNTLDRVSRFHVALGLAAVSFVLLCLVAWILVVHKPADEQQMLKEGAAKDRKDGAVLPPCGDDWIWFQHKCFHFSDYAGDWTTAKDSCAALNSTLALIDTKQELDFLLRHKRDPDLWIGLSRRDPDQPWIWVDGTVFNNWFTVEDYAECAYLNYGTVRSSECYSKRQWSCSKYPHMKEV